MLFRSVVPDETEEMVDDTEIGYKTINYDATLDGRSIKMGGIINQSERKFTKRGDSMGIGVIEDLYGQMQFVLYSRAFDLYRDLLQENELVIMEGKLQIKEGEMPKISVYKVSPLVTSSEPEDEPETVRATAAAPINFGRKKLVLTVHGARDEIKGAVKEARKLLAANKGKSTVTFVFDWGSATTPEKVEITETLLSDLKTVLGRINVVVAD